MREDLYGEMKKDLVIEIGTEELPASVVGVGEDAAACSSLIEALLAQTELYSDNLTYNIFATPPKVIIYIKNLPHLYY